MITSTFQIFNHKIINRNRGLYLRLYGIRYSIDMKCISTINLVLMNCLHLKLCRSSYQKIIFKWILMHLISILVKLSLKVPTTFFKSDSFGRTSLTWEPRFDWYLTAVRTSFLPWKNSWSYIDPPMVRKIVTLCNMYAK